MFSDLSNAKYILTNFDLYGSRDQRVRILGIVSIPWTELRQQLPISWKA